MELLEKTEKKLKIVPPLRFKGFKDNWQKIKLADIVSNKSAKYNPEKESRSFKCIELEHLSCETGQLLGFADSKELASIKNIFNKGDVLFGKLRPYLKKYLLAPFNGVCSSEIWVLTGKGISNEFLFFFIQQHTFIELANLSSGSKMPRADWNVVSSGIFNIPSLPEQQKIASFLSAVDQKIQQLMRKKELLEQYKKGVMQQIFSGKLRFKDENGKAYPKWEEKRLGNIATIVKGKGISKTDIVENGTLECIRYGELYTHYKERITKIFSRTNLDKSDLVLSAYNDIIIPSSGETQIDIARASCVLKSGVALGGDLNILVSQQNGVFLSYYINHSLKYEIAKIAQGNSVVHLYPSQLEVLKVELPNLDEQRKIADFIGSIDNKIESIELQIAKTQEFKKGLLQQMFV